MIFDAEAYAEGICNSAAGSTIEVFVDTLNEIIDQGNGGIIDDAIQYRRSDDDDEDAENDNALVEEYQRVNERLIELRDAIVQREKDAGESTYFGED
jgi:hypothetical protein